jgi:hypothetical protein
MGGRIPHEQIGRFDAAGAARETAAKSAETTVTAFILKRQGMANGRVASSNGCKAAIVYGMMSLYVNQLYSGLCYLT